MNDLIQFMDAYLLSLASLANINIDCDLFCVFTYFWINNLFNFYFQGTEVKAITYSNMQIHENEKNDVYVIIDI